MPCRCNDLRNALIEAKKEVEAAVEVLAREGIFSAQIGSKLRERWGMLIKETQYVETDGASEPASQTGTSAATEIEGGPMAVVEERVGVLDVEDGDIK